MSRSGRGQPNQSRASNSSWADHRAGGGSGSSRARRLAHRGDHRVARENTIGALAAALDVPGCDGLEFDVRAARDGTPVILHDPDLGRVFGRSERADACSVAELAALGVPSLAEALGAVRASPFLGVELKEDVVAAVIPLLTAARGDPPAETVLSSFEVGVLERLAALVPDWPRWLNTHDLDDAAVERARALGCRGVSVDWRALDGRGLRRAAEARLEVAAWTIRRRPTAARLDQLGVAVLCVEGAALAA